PPFLFHFQVHATDVDPPSNGGTIQYRIIKAPGERAKFSIDKETGIVKTLYALDRDDPEREKEIYITVIAEDNGTPQLSDACTMKITVEDINDNEPMFDRVSYEELVPEDLQVGREVMRISATDIDDGRNSIVTYELKANPPADMKYFRIDPNTGIIYLGHTIDKRPGYKFNMTATARDQGQDPQSNRVGLNIRKLNRDKPGIPSYQVRIGAQDEDGAGQSGIHDFVINLTDINDNAPYLDMTGPVVWPENKGPGTITTLVANDIDSEENGGPFRFEMAPEASDDIRSKFSIIGDQLNARTMFDREEKKMYQIPIAITDSGKNPMTGTSILTVIIGDQNDNPMKFGESSIFVYNYKGENPDTEVGRVYVNDPDDWDLPDKVFNWRDAKHKYFDLNPTNGMITMRNGTHGGNYVLYFKVTEESSSFPRHSVEAVVNITVQVIPEEAVDKSGSFRLSGITAEEFIEPNSKGISKATILKNRLAKLLNTSVENVDVFTVLHSPHNLNSNQLDVRFSAHGSPYYAPEKINMAIANHLGIIEKELGAEILMINIDECLQEKVSCPDSLSCINFLNKSNVPSAVYTNTTSFVGVNAVIDPFCKCEFPQRVCYNGGTPDGDRCICPDKYEGPRCEKVSIGFNGNGYALYPTLQSCADFTLSFDIRAYKPDGLVFYVGPTSQRSSMGIQDFMSFELHNGFPVLLVDYGTGTTRLDMQEIKLSDGGSHHIDIILSNTVSCSSGFSCNLKGLKLIEGHPTDIFIHLIDVNDNIPVFVSDDGTSLSHSVLENEPPGTTVMQVKAVDADSSFEHNQITYALADNTDNFAIDKDTGTITTLKTFDREEKDVYHVKVIATDSSESANHLPGSKMHNQENPDTEVGRVYVNDPDDWDLPDKVFNWRDAKHKYFDLNPTNGMITMRNGTHGENPDTEVGRVYVNDPDDWDLPDKVFNWRDAKHKYFDLNPTNGMITMRNGTHGGNYVLYFKVTEESSSFPRHSVEAVVNITVQVIQVKANDIDDASTLEYSIVDGNIGNAFKIEPKTGTIFVGNTLDYEKITSYELHIRAFDGASEDFCTVFIKVTNVNDNLPEFENDIHEITLEEETIPKDCIATFKAYDPDITNRSAPQHIKYFMVDHEELGLTIDQEGCLMLTKLISQTSGGRLWIRRASGAEILMINIDECLQEKVSCPDSLSCINFLNKSNVPSAVYTNTTSFVGVNAVIDPFCKCEFPQRVCYNGGTPDGDRCICPDKYEGPRCEKVSIGFNGNGYALYPTLQSCADFTLSFDIRAYKPDGLVFYVGPTSQRSSMGIQDFMSFELHNGFPVLLVDYGTGTTRLDMQEIKLSDGGSHHIDIILSNTSMELQVDRCKLSQCLTLKTPKGSNVLLNVNGPLQLGGTFLDLDKLGQQMNWSSKPSMVPFSGCISNMTFNRKLYNLGFPSLNHNAEVDCGNVLTGAFVFGVDSSFLIAILICCAILLLLLLAVIVQRKKTDDNYKDTDDIRENIIDYEEEGGGEGDQTGFNLDVLRCTSMYAPDDLKMPNGHLIKASGDEVPDICGFLDGKKHHVDNDPETNPFDDVRHYAYEGDGNTTGSLSSLASVTDEGDLNFDYLSNFGPRFRKLADMYGEDPSDEEDENYQPAASESWC
ncbi:DE-cadherin, partial [Diaphorina citri]|uniref:DE-cadherin n=1 Tax=Diaphorina citri TaxID=121845 RepID=A0A3Q0J862_DIACI